MRLSSRKLIDLWKMTVIKRKGTQTKASALSNKAIHSRGESDELLCQKIINFHQERKDNEISRKNLQKEAQLCRSILVLAFAPYKTHQKFGIEILLALNIEVLPHAVIVSDHVSALFRFLQRFLDCKMCTGVTFTRFRISICFYIRLLAFHFTIMRFQKSWIRFSFISFG